MKKMKVGIIGCGNISQAYFNAIKTFRMLEIKACADINPDAAKAKAEENKVQALTVDEILADKEIDAIVNLTIPSVHVEIGMRALEAGKHVHSEKPLGIDLKEAEKLIALGKKKNLRVGCAPDTFLGAGGQTCRKIIDDGWLGKVTSGNINFLGGGPEGWHPNVGFFYKKGGGPMLDLGPYYITQLINLLGPVKKVCAITSMAWENRLDTHPNHFGELVKVEVPTHYAGAIEMHSGAVITVTVSFDVKAGGLHNPIELYGTQGSLCVPDPNGFGGVIKAKCITSKEWKEMPFTHSYDNNMRGIGLADIACAIEKNRLHRCSGELAYHALEVMLAFEESSKAGKHIELKSTCVQPAALPSGLPVGMLD